MNYLDLRNETWLLYKTEAFYKIPAAPVIRYLTIETSRPLPDLLPPIPLSQLFTWPSSMEVDYRNYWRKYDNGGR